jgi:2-methylisocitrate lyase-like PEP mutase family enzyme
VLLFNAWDAGSAKLILAAGAKAIATSSWSVAEAQGYRDGEAIPIEFAEQIVARGADFSHASATKDASSALVPSRRSSRSHGQSAHY